ncbi:Hypothetical predicted protein [Cloeon dipterum]|uniref:histone acetyltransferase n=1 Tax=Cloeon dipterum TaxID=197152 RepID=A0A8S1D145_9INSE|nr:Hypothetical predicted protein [Cloeon dipterum]
MSSSPKIPRLEELQSPNYSNEEVTKQIIQHLFSLVHSQNCHQQDECAYPDCWKVKNTIEHMATCLEHWHECTQRDCPVCSPLRKDNSEKEKLQAAADPQDSTLDKSGASTAREGATGGTGASSNAKDPVQPSSTDGSRIFDYALDEDANIGTRCELPDLHKIWHKSFKQHHSEARKIYKKKNQPVGVYYPSCVIETLRKSNALNMIFGQATCAIAEGLKPSNKPSSAPTRAAYRLKLICATWITIRDKATCQIQVNPSDYCRALRPHKSRILLVAHNILPPLRRLNMFRFQLIQPKYGFEIIESHRRQLKALLHAKTCGHRPTRLEGGLRQLECFYPDCKRTKYLLDHMLICWDGAICRAPLCWDSKQILSHWSQCTQGSYCHLCSPLLQTNPLNQYESREAPEDSQEETSASTLPPVQIRDSSVDQPNFNSAPTFPHSDRDRHIKRTENEYSDPTIPSTDPAPDFLQDSPVTMAQSVLEPPNQSTQEPNAIDMSKVTKYLQYLLTLDVPAGPTWPLTAINRKNESGLVSESCIDIKKIHESFIAKIHNNARKVNEIEKQHDTQKHTSEELLYPFCVLDTLRKNSLVELILGPEEPSGLNLHQKQQAFTLIGYLCYLREADALKRGCANKLCLHPNCSLVIQKFYHLEGECKHSCEPNARVIYVNPQLAAESKLRQSRGDEFCLPPTTCQIEHSISPRRTINMSQIEPTPAIFSIIKTIKMQQLHLKALLHAQKCTHRKPRANIGHWQEIRTKCPDPECAKMKEVLNHTLLCTTIFSCKVQLCWSSKDLLSHWFKCADQDCPLCAPCRPTDKSKLHPNAEGCFPNTKPLDAGELALHEAIPEQVESPTDGSLELNEMRSYYIAFIHETARMIYEKEKESGKLKQPAETFNSYCAIEAVTNVHLGHLIFGPVSEEEEEGMSLLQQQQTLTLIGYQCLRRVNVTNTKNQYMCSHPSCTSLISDFGHVDTCKKDCDWPWCQSISMLVDHWKKCKSSDADCRVCSIVSLTVP